MAIMRLYVIMMVLMVMVMMTMVVTIKDGDDEWIERKSQR